MLYLPYAALLASVVSAAGAKNEHLKVDFSVLRGDSRSTAVKGATAKVVSSEDYAYLYLANAQQYYQSTLQLGSNGNAQSVLVDTGSSDLWVMASDVACYSQVSSRKRSIEEFPVFEDARLLDLEDVVPTITKGAEKRDATTSTVSVDRSTCTSLGSFNTAASDSFKINSTAPAFGIEYGDGTYAKGVWGTDYVAVGSLNVSDVSIAVVNETTSDVAVFGIGLSGLEVTYDDNTTQPAYTYENFPVRLKSTGVINKVAYSLFLNSPDAASGSVLFGAVDHEKYTGQLQTVPIINVYPQYYDQPIAFYVGVDSITLGDSKQNISVSNDTIPALLDSGTTLTYLPKALVKSIAASLNGVPGEYGFYEVDCGYNTSSAYLEYNLSGVSIRAPLNDLILSDDSGTKCYLGLVGSKSRKPRAIFGDSFLRHAYVVYNLEDFEISLAPIKYTDSENIEVISSTVPSAVQAPGYSSTHILTSLPPHSATATLSLPVDPVTTAVSSTGYYSSSAVYSANSVSAFPKYWNSSAVASVASTASGTSLSISGASTGTSATGTGATGTAATGTAATGTAATGTATTGTAATGTAATGTAATGTAATGTAATGTAATGTAATGTAATTGTVTNTVATTIITITSCSDHKCTTTAVPATQGPTTVTTNGETTIYTTWCPVTSSSADVTEVTVTSTARATGTTVTNTVATTIITITSCSDHKCTTTAVPATQGATTLTYNGETTIYTTWCPVTAATTSAVATTPAASTSVGTVTSTGANGSVTTYTTTSTSVAAVATGTVTTTVATTIITITSCSDNKCTKTSVPATQGPTTVTTNGETTVYTTWCPVTSSSTTVTPVAVTTTGPNGAVTTYTSTTGAATGAVTTGAPAGTTVITSTTTGANGVVTTYTSTSTGAVGVTSSTGSSDSTVFVTVTKTGANGSKTTYTTTTKAPATGVSSVAAQSTQISSAASTGTPAISTAFNGAGKVGASLAMFALPFAYFL